MGTEEDMFVIAIKSALDALGYVAKKVDQGVHSARETFIYAGLTYEQRYVLNTLWMRVNLPVPRLPKQNERLIKQCRDLGVAEWRIQTVLNSRPTPYR